MIKIHDNITLHIANGQPEILPRQETEPKPITADSSKLEITED